jgi:hypothetical protein
LRRVRRAARYYALSCYVGVIGAHGRYGDGKCRRSPLRPIQLVDKARYREIGCDLFSTSDVLPKIHLKIYTARSPYAGNGPQRPLAEWAVARGAG